jgi:hypothetical protein
MIRNGLPSRFYNLEAILWRLHCAAPRNRATRRSNDHADILSLFDITFANVVLLSQEASEEGILMLGWKRRFALAAWFGLLAFLGCSGGGSSQPTPSKASNIFSPASIAGTVNDPGTATDEVVDGMTTTQNFTLNLSPTHSVSGTVANLTTGLPIAGATVRILNTPIPPTTTDANGMYLFASVVEGTYDMQASAPGFMTQTQTGVVVNVVNQDVVVDFGLASSGTPNQLNGVWGSGASNVWAVGNYGTILHWDGSGWSRVSSGTTNGLRGVWGSGASDVWAVGDYGIVQHWNGSAWTSVSSGTTSHLNGVWGSGASDVWAVSSYDTILHWNGSAWSRISSGTMNYLNGVWGSGASDVWAVGYSVTTYVGTIRHWDGNAWTSVSSGPTNRLFGVWGSGASDVWAVGDGTILHWDGSAWTSVSSASYYLGGVWGSGASDVWAVGYGGTLLHWDGSAWTSVPSGTTSVLYGVWGSGASDVWAVGIYGTILERRHAGNAGTLQGTVTDTTGLPVAGAQVQAVGPVTRSATTRGDGTYRLTLVPEGSYDMTATHPDHNPGSAMGVMVVEGQTTTQDFLLTGAGILAGTVTDSQGAPLAGVHVQVVGPVTRAFDTGSDGSYLLRLPVGTYDTTATLYAYGPGTATDDVADGMTTTQDFTLNLEPAHSVSGIVSNLATGLPFAGATVRILNTPIPPTTTDANGMYLFALVLEGTYDMQATAPGFMTQTQTGVVVNQDVVVDFGLDSAALCAHVPGNLVANCGFESGDFQAWVRGCCFGLSVSQGNPHTGIWALFGEDSGLSSSIEQQLATTPGATYQLCYWLANIYQFQGIEFWVYWDGVTIRDLQNPPAFPYTQTCHDVVASGGSTTLKFGFRGSYDVDTLWLDDVSVVAE